MRIIVIGFLPLLAGCVHEGGVTITTHPSYVERQLNTTLTPLMCPTVGMAMDIVQNSEVHPSCGYFSILAPRVRSEVEVHGRRYTVMEIGPPGNERYWLERGRIYQ